MGTIPGDDKPHTHFFLLRSFSTDQQHRFARHAGDTLGDAANKQPGKPLAPMRADDDQVGRPGLRIVGDGLGNAFPTQRASLRPRVGKVLPTYSC